VDGRAQPVELLGDGAALHRVLDHPAELSQQRQQPPEHERVGSPVTAWLAERQLEQVRQAGSGQRDPAAVLVVVQQPRPEVQLAGPLSANDTPGGPMIGNQVVP